MKTLENYNQKTATTTLHGIQTGIECLLNDFKKSVRESEIIINHYNLESVIERYWMDVERLHKYHKIDRVDCHKIAGYLTYWICKIKPLEVASTVFLRSKLGYFINELACIYIGLGRLNETRGEKGQKIIDLAHLNKDSFLQDFLYTLRYRNISGDSLTYIYYFIDKTS